ncbi:uncharacterized protein LOC117591189 [Drosophila guanche]|uniref:Uncharacterized protein n=1 Tax=Drosophila guanche TaxID=7266 RepID=A0A3B0KLY6_DROGU|nr:uncharacterized protein LOC117591189 [Drosophila guanche]SPP89640.1 Hypothetical predicted protein [Drosophila guanche]
MTPFDDFVYLINHVLLGEEPTIEDFILLVGTLVAFIAFILWCCFPIQPKEPGPHRQFTCKIIQNPIKAFDAAISTDNSNAANASPFPSPYDSGVRRGLSGKGNAGADLDLTSNMYNGSNGSYSRNGTAAMHNYYVKNGHHCCT